MGGSLVYLTYVGKLAGVLDDGFQDPTDMISFAVGDNEGMIISALRVSALSFKGRK